MAKQLDTELDGVKAFGELRRAIRELPDAAKLTGPDSDDDDGTDWDFRGGLALLREHIEQMFGPLQASPRSNGFLKALAWSIALDVHGFSVDDSTFEAGQVLDDFAKFGPPSS